MGTLAYVALVLFIRISGKRTLTKLNAFDLVVTVALGSTLATVLLNDSVALAEGVLAMALLIFLQFVITWLSVRSPWFESLVKSEPTLLLHRGPGPSTTTIEGHQCRVQQRRRRSRPEPAVPLFGADVRLDFAPDETGRCRRDHQTRADRCFPIGFTLCPSCR